MIDKMVGATTVGGATPVVTQDSVADDDIGGFYGG